MRSYNYVQGPSLTVPLSFILLHLAPTVCLYFILSHLFPSTRGVTQNATVKTQNEEYWWGALCQNEHCHPGEKAQSGNKKCKKLIKPMNNFIVMADITFPSHTITFGHFDRSDNSLSIFKTVACELMTLPSAGLAVAVFLIISSSSPFRQDLWGATTLSTLQSINSLLETSWAVGGRFIPLDSIQSWYFIVISFPSVV